LLRFHHEKSKGQFDDHWPFLFNAIIDSLYLREVSIIGRQFTWANSLPNPTYEKLDRVLMDANMETKFPILSIRALEVIEGFSDHAPILLTTGNPKPTCNHRFMFELAWLQRDGFHDMVKAVWDRPTTAVSTIQRWNYKIRALHSHLSGWAQNVMGVLKKRG
jgi:response regulator RpfG family c-di-GMP phosphodiesterase